MGTRREEQARQPGPDGAGLIITAMVAVSFGSYGASLLFGDDAAGGWINVLASAVVLAMVALNFGGVSAAAKGQSLIVIVLLGVFAVFIAVTLANADWSLLAPSTYPPARDIVASVALTFFAYLGFAVISFTAGSLRDPQRTLPRAMYLGIAMAASIYVLVSLGTFGSLTPAEVSRYGDTALACGRDRPGPGGLHDDGPRRAARDRILRERQCLCRPETSPLSRSNTSSRRSSAGARASELPPV